MSVIGPPLLPRENFLASKWLYSSHATSGSLVFNRAKCPISNPLSCTSTVKHATASLSSVMVLTGEFRAPTHTWAEDASRSVCPKIWYPFLGGLCLRGCQTKSSTNLAKELYIAVPLALAWTGPLPWWVLKPTWLYVVFPLCAHMAIGNPSYTRTLSFRIYIYIHPICIEGCPSPIWAKHQHMYICFPYT